MDRKELFGERMRSLREARNWTQDHLAEEMGISTQYVSGIERGKENPTFDMLVKFADGLGVEMWELFDFGHEATPKELRGMLKGYAADLSDEKLKLAVKLVRAMAR